MRQFPIIAACFVVAGCAANVTNTAAPVYAPAPEVPGTSYIGSVGPNDQVLGEISATGCQRLTSDPLPSREYVIGLLKKEAVARGGNAVANVSFSESPVSLIGNCWATVSARGVAVRRQ